MTILQPLGAWEAGTPEWHAARRDGLGGSEVAAALGLSPWCSPFTLWHRKKGTVGHGGESESMRWGKILEPIILAEYRRRRDGVKWADHPGAMWIADGWRIASPDAKTSEELVEAKTADSNTAWEWGPDGSGDPAAIPVYYRPQCIWYMDVTGVHQLTLSVLIGGNDYREYDVPWDADEAATIREGAAAFWQTVVDNVRPAIDDSASTYETVRELHPEIEDESVELPAGLVDDWFAADDQLKAATTARGRARSLVAGAMGAARYGTVAGERRVRRQSTSGGTPYPVLVRPRGEPS